MLDEPTSVLTPQEAEEMLGFVRSLARSREITVVIITHKLREVATFVDEVTVMRRGRVVGTGSTTALGPAELTAMMIGEPRAPDRPMRQGAPSSEKRLVVKQLTIAGEQGRGGLDVEFLDVRAGEIVGVAGVSGNGQKELVEVLGGQVTPTDGEVLVGGALYHATRTEAQARGVRVLPEEPLRNGCVGRMSVTDNLNLRSFDHDADGRHRTWLDRAAMTGRAQRMIEGFGIRAPSREAPIAVLSGGNVQRCVLARELEGKVNLLIVANPCFGLDVKAVVEVRARIMAARNGGAGVLLVSEDLDEILELADRIVVMRQGQVVYETPAAGADRQTIGAHMIGHA